MKKHRFEVQTLHWRGITIEVAYEAEWMRREGFYCPCHLTVTSVTPNRCPLPITGTGYRSLFTDPALVEEAGGPLAFVKAELDAAATSVEWRKHEEQQRQLTLF